MATINIDYSSLPFSDLGTNDCFQHGAFDFEMQQVPTSRTTSHFSAQATLEGASDDQHGLLGKNNSPSPTGHDTQDTSQSASVQRPDHSKTHKLQAWRRKLQGWRFGLAVSASSATFVLFTNVLIVIGAAATSKLDNGIGTLFMGDCQRVNVWNTALYVIINILSSILLSASNYAMQCLSSPTRAECDSTHARRDWLDIGVNGVRNLTRVSWQRRILWTLLGISSIPIHLLFNSAVFKTLDANEHSMFVVSKDFLEGQQQHIAYTEPYPDEYRGHGNNALEGLRGKYRDWVESAHRRYHEKSSLYVNLDPAECISTYGASILSGHSNVFLVTQGDDPDINMYTAGSSDYRTAPFSNVNVWVCSDDSRNIRYDYCDVSAARKSASNWTINGQKIDNYISEVTEPHCKLEFSVHILVAVIICNFIKSATMFWTLLRQRETTLVTFGDALASWLDHPDDTTAHRCLMSKKDFLSSHTWDTNKPPPVPFSSNRTKRKRWHNAVSTKRWTVSMLSCIATLSIVGWLLRLALGNDTGVPNPLVDYAFGALSPNAVTGIGTKYGLGALAGCVLLANLPQMILSFLYVMYNGLYTSMHLAHEYGGHANDHKPLRVTTPKGSQRSTYWLQLPYAYGVPLIGASATMHWLISQAIFLARVAVWEDGMQSEEKDMTFSAVGYSSSAILSTIVFGTCMLLVVIGVGFRRLPSSMPIAGSCSMALAAAARRPESDIDAAVLPVKWGVVARESEATGDVGHCCFTSEEITEPQEGKLYAGDVKNPGNSLRWRVGNQL